MGGKKREGGKEGGESEGLTRNSAPCLMLESPNMTWEFCKEPPWTVPMVGVCCEKVTILLTVKRCGVLE